MLSFACGRKSKGLFGVSCLVICVIFLYLVFHLALAVRLIDLNKHLHFYFSYQLCEVPNG